MMKRTIQVCTWLALAGLTGVYGCSGDDDPATTPGDMSDGSDDSGDGGDGDSEPDPAGIAQGNPCNEDGEACAAGLTCVDGVCCDEPCDGVCESCRGDISGGFDGTCTPLPAGDERIIEAEDYEDCPGIQTCDGQGACFARAAGESCDSDSQCGSGLCTDGVCCDTRCAGTCESCATGSCSIVENAPDPGTCESECFEGGRCDGNAIGVECQSDGECGSRICSIVCVLADGEACTANDQCVNVCVEGTCELRSPVTGSCDSGETADCQSGLACLSSVCLIPSGSTVACTDDNECEDPICLSGTCSDLVAAGGICENTAQCADPNNLVCCDDEWCFEDENTCVTATLRLCSANEECPGTRRCSESIMTDSRLPTPLPQSQRCYDWTSLINVTPRIRMNGESFVLTATYTCDAPGSNPNLVERTFTWRPGDPDTTTGPSFACAEGSVVDLNCSLDQPLSSSKRLDDPPFRTDEVGRSDVSMRFSDGAIVRRLLVEKDGFASCWITDFN